MSLLDEIKNNRPRVGSVCSFQGLFKELSKADRDDLVLALSDLTLSSSAISRALVARGYNIRRDTVQRHRRRECACDK